MTPKAIAADLKISPQAYGDIERGKTDVHLSRILQISQALDVLPQELVSIESAY